MRLLRSILLTLIAVGMVAASAVSTDQFLAQAELILGAGAFGLAWLTPST